MLSPGRFTSRYEELAESYDDAYRGPRWDLYDAVTMAVADSGLPPSPARILDAGAGTGKFALGFLSRGYEVILLDPSVAMLEKARRRISNAGLEERATFVQGSVDAIDLPAESVDFVFSEGDPLSYCTRTFAVAASEIVRVLRPGAAFYASVDNRTFAALGLLARGQTQAALAALENGRAMDPYGIPVHAFGPSELTETFVNAGAVDVRVAGKVVLSHMIQDSVILPLLGDPVWRQALFSWEIAAATDPSLAGMASHLHVMGRRST